MLDPRTTSAAAHIVLPNGLMLFYEPVHYDGSRYPSAPSAASTDVFAFLLKSVISPNGYLTCFENSHSGDKTLGRVSVLTAIYYGPALKDCDNLPPLSQMHRLTFEYVDPTAAGLDYFAPMSFRFGVPVSFNNLLKAITIFAADIRPGAATAVQQVSYKLHHQVATATETRVPRLEKVTQETALGGLPAQTKTRVIRQFSYGSRASAFDPNPKLLDSGPDAREFPSSLSGTEGRPFRQPRIFYNPGGLLQIGYDQNDIAATPASGLSKQWSLMDMNGDGLLDVLVADEKGADRTQPWPTYEENTNPGNKPPQQWAFISEGVKNNTLASTKVVLQTDPSSPQHPLKAAYDPAGPGTPYDLLNLTQDGISRWIWQEGLGQSRVSMPQAITSPEIRNGGNCPGQDTRLWPYLPDGSFGGSEGSIGDKIVDGLSRGNVLHDFIGPLISGIAQGFIPRHSISASLSGWLDWNGDGIADWVVTPGMIERFTLPGICIGLPYKPEFASTSWYVAPGQSDVGQTAQATYNSIKVDGPGAPVGLPLNFSTESGQSEYFGITVPIGSLISASVSAAMNGGTPNPQDVAAVIADAITPRGQAGGSATIAAESVTAALVNAAVKGKESGSFAKGAGNFLMSTFGLSLDLTLRTGGNRGRSQSRAEIIDFNADGLPDYLLYDSVGILDSSRKGDILLYLNDGKGGFLTAQQINANYPTNVESMVQKVQNEADNAAKKVDEIALLKAFCDGIIFNPQANAACRSGLPSAMFLPMKELVRATNEAADAAEDFLRNSTDALPEDKRHPEEARFLAKAVWAAWPGAGVSPDTALTAADNAAKTAQLIAHTVKQLAFPSRLNMLAKGNSHLEPGGAGEEVVGMTVQKQGLIDLNGDGLPDYVVSEDAQKQCSRDAWDVYWGKGTSDLSAGRGFTATPSCIKVPKSPPDVLKFDRENVTLPLQVDFIRQKDNQSDSLGYAALAAIDPSFIVVPAILLAQNKQTYSRIDSFVSLVDYNQDGRPDLLVANKEGKWDPLASSNLWLVYLNNGRGFDLLRPVTVPSVSASVSELAGLNIVHPLPTSLNVAFPSLKSGYNLDPTWGQKRSVSSVDVAFVDIDNDGIADITRRVLHSQYTDPTNGETRWRAGFIYWSRQGSGPQDLLLEERDPLTGSRVLVHYLPAPLFQWKDGVPDGNPPSEGHRPGVGGAPFLVRSLTNEPLLGRASQRTRLGFDYKDPHFDQVTRSFTGFERFMKTPLDPSSGGTITASTSSMSLVSQRPNSRGGETQARVVHTGGGTPISEVLTSYVEVPTAKNGPGPAESYYSAQNDQIAVEFPYDLTKGAVLDIGFDGRLPLVNRADRLGPLAANAGGLVFDPELPTGGAMRLDATKSQWAEFSTQQASLNLNQFTVETWLNPSVQAARRIIAQHPDGYELAIEASGDVTFGVKIGGSWIPRASGGPLPVDRWSHVVASYDGSTLRIFVNTVLKGTVTRLGLIVYPPAPNSVLRVGCSGGLITTQLQDCFMGSIGELRVYPEAWASPPRITRTRTLRNTTVNASNFGMPAEIWQYGDIARLDDDFHEQLTYAIPSGGKIQDALAVSSRRILEPNGINLGGYLRYSEVSYDGLPLGQVTLGNPTRNAIYSGMIGVAQKPIPDTVTETRYSDKSCPGVATESIDPEGAHTQWTYDPTCNFKLTAKNALGHTVRSEYFGVNGVAYSDPVSRFAGLYGQIKTIIDANGELTSTNHDEWGRVIATVAPYESYKRPGLKTTYIKPVCRIGSTTGATVDCDEMTATELASPAQVTAFTWDDTQSDYRKTHAFGDGQSQTEAINSGKRDWIVSGVRDFDAVGRVITTYKPQYLSAAVAPTITACPPAGEWCDTENITGDPLRSPALAAHVQTAYDSQGRVIRVYSPDVPACHDPAARSASGELLCDAVAKSATPLGHYTQFEFPKPGVVRTIDANGVPAVMRHDVEDRIERVEEYMKNSFTPYSTADYAYDRNGNVRQVTDIKGNTMAASHDALGRKRTTTDPDMGTWAYKYDKRSDLIEQEDAAGALTKNYYDVLGRLTLTEYWTPLMPLPEGCGLIKPIEKDTPRSDPEGTLPHDVPTFKWSPCGPICPACICTDPYEGRGNSQWHKAPEFTNQERFTPLPNKVDWKRDRRLVPLPLIAGDADNGLASLPLPFEFALTPTRIVNLQDNNIAVATPVTDTARWPAGHRLLVSVDGRIVFARTDTDNETETIKKELAITDNERLPVHGEIALYPLWDNLVATGGISSAVVGEAPHRRLILEWDGVYRANREARAVFRVILSESSFEIEYQYDVLDLGSSTATIGLQYKSTGSSDLESVQYSFNTPSVSSGQALTSLTRIAESPLQFTGGMRDRAGERLWGAFAFDVDLRDVSVAELSFQHSWDTRCSAYPRGSCPLDRMTVTALVDGEVVTLLSNSDLTTNEAFNVGIDRIAEAPTMSVSFPRSLVGKRFTVLFTFDAVDGGASVSRDGWIIDKINVTGKQLCSKRGRALQDRVERLYDSAEALFSYDSATPVLDLTFDVPGVMSDRSVVHNDIPLAVSSVPVVGVSGKAVKLGPNGGPAITLPATKLLPFGQALTVEAWVYMDDLNTGSAPTFQSFVSQEGTFTLGTGPDEHLHCLVNLAGVWHEAGSVGIVIPGEWIHVAMTYDGTAVQCFVNGDGSGVNISGDLFWTGGPVFVGRDVSGHPYRGLIDEVRIFSGVRSPTEVLADSQLPHRGGPPRGNVLDLRFAHPQSPEMDTSGANNHATLINAKTMPGVQGTAVNYDGSVGDLIKVPHHTSLASDELTAELWVKTVISGDRLLVGKWNGIDPGWRLSLQQGSGQIRFEVRTRVQTRDTWEKWMADTTGLPAQGNGWCGTPTASPTAGKLWVAPASGYFTLSTVGGANWDTVIFVRDVNGNPVGCNDNAVGNMQSYLSFHAIQGETYRIFVSGNGGASGPFSLGITGPRGTNTPFVTLETVHDGRWHHIAGVYDGKSLRVYIDGKPAHRTCRAPEIEIEPGVTKGGEEIPCREVPEKRCRTEWEGVNDRRYPNAICATGSIFNAHPIYAGNYDPLFFPSHLSLNGMEDEIRISNYPKRDFEMAASARLYSAYTAVLGGEVEIRNRTSTDHMHLDALGRLVTAHRGTRFLVPRTVPIVGTYLSRTSYDNLDRSASLRYPDGEVAVSNYDRGGTQVGLTGYGNFTGFSVFGKQPYLLETDATTTGQIRRLLLGNGVTTKFVYDDGPTKMPTTGAANNNGTFGNDLLTDITTILANGTPQQGHHYDYDALGNVRSRRTAPTALHSASSLSSYSYDDLNRIKTFTLQSGSNPAQAATYDYDELGNLIAKEGATLTYGIGTATQNCGRAQANSMPHAVMEFKQGNVTTEYCYDANGSIAKTTKGGATLATFHHDIPGKLRNLTNNKGTFYFSYDGNGQRIHKSEPRGVTVEPFEFYREIPSGTEKYYFAGSRRIARRVGPTQTDVFWYHPGHLGSTNFMTHAAGDELQDAYSEYGPFGNALPTKDNNSGPPPPNGYGGVDTPDVNINRSGGFQFTGQELDGTGLYDYGARYYDPSLGRFLAPDVIQPGHYAQDLNRYSYVLNNPLRYVDPTGHNVAPPVSGVELKCDHCRLLGMPDMPDYRIPDMVSDPEGYFKWRMDVITTPIPQYTGPVLSAVRPRDPNEGSFPKHQLNALYGSVTPTLFAGVASVYLGSAIGGGILVAWGGLDTGTALREGDYAMAALAGAGTVLNIRMLTLSMPTQWSRTPKSLMDEMVVGAARQGKGLKIIENLGDSRFKGMEKWSYGETSATGLRSEVHYVRDPKTGKLMDFKFKHHAERFRLVGTESGRKSGVLPPFVPTNTPEHKTYK